MDSGSRISLALILARSVASTSSVWRGRAATRTGSCSACLSDPAGRVRSGVNYLAINFAATVIGKGSAAQSKGAGMHAARTWAGRVFLLLGTLLTIGAIAAGLVHREVLDAGRFARSVDSIRSDPAVSEQLGQEITRQVLALDPNLVALRPVIEVTATALVRSSAFTPIVTAAARQLHEAFSNPNSGQLVLRLADVGAVVVPAVRALAPTLAKSLPADFDLTLARIGSQDFAGRTIRFARTVDTLSWLLPLLAAVSFLLALLLARQRRARISQVGLCVTSAGVVIWIAVLIGNVIVDGLPRDSLRNAATYAAWHQLAATTDRTVLLVILAGGALFCVSTGWLRTLAMRTTQFVRYAWRQPRTDRGRAVRAVVLAAFGLALVLWRTTVIRVGSTVAGVLLIAWAVNSWITRRSPEAQTQPTAQQRTRQALPGRRGRRVTAAIALLAVVGLVVLSVAGIRPTVGKDNPVLAASPQGTCNGYAVLCDRQYDRVAYAATHNSMAAADEPGWYLAEQPDGLVGQLNAGVRALLFDTWLGRTTQRANVVTTTGAAHNRALAELNNTWGAQTVASALRVRNLLGLTPTGPPEPYMCHGLCEFGSTLWEPAMEDVRKWMDANPREVITFIIQDEGVTPEQTAQVFQKAGLLPYVYTQREGEPWPTLGQMIKSGKRLVVFMENESGGTEYPWQMPGFTWMQDTPFHYTSADQFSCADFRGSSNSSLFLLNHWLSNYLTRVTDSAAVNSDSVLGARVSQCERERRFPNFVAVNFYNEGDLFGVVDRLNGVP